MDLSISQPQGRDGYIAVGCVIPRGSSSELHCMGGKRGSFSHIKTVCRSSAARRRCTRGE